MRRRSPERLAPGFLNELLYPAEAPAARRRAPSPRSPSATAEDAVSIFGWHVNWLVAFFLLSVAFAFALRGRMGVTL